MKHFLLISLLLASAPAWADLVPIFTDKEIEQKIEAYNDPQVSACRLNNEVGRIAQAAAQGNRRAQTFLAKESLAIDPALDEKNGLNVKLKKRCEQKDAEACYVLQLIYLQGRFGVTDQKRALSYGEQAVALDSGAASDAAAYLLAEAYIEGKSVEKDEVKARALLEKASRTERSHCTRYPFPLRERALSLLKALDEKAASAPQGAADPNAPAEPAPKNPKND